MTSSKDAIITQQADRITKEEIAAAYQRWQAPRVVSVTDVDTKEAAMLTVEELEKLQKEAEKEGYQVGYDKGHQEGYQAGLAAGQQEIKQQLAVLQDMLDCLATPLAELDQQVEQDLVQLAITMTRQLVRRELKLHPEHVIGAMRAALAVLPVSDRKLKVYLHPQDIELVKTGLAMDSDGAQWTWIEDPLLTRGGIRIETEDSTIDASVEARLNSVINKLLGEERSDEQSQPD